MKKSASSRRQFIRNSSLGAAAAGLGATGHLPQAERSGQSLRLPREVWVGTVALSGLQAETPAEMVGQVLKVMEDLVPYRPDIICLPETFAYTGIREPFQIKDIAEKVPGAVVSPFRQFARQHNCCVICPTYTRDGEKIFITAVVIDRKGEVIGEYRKMRPAGSELEAGVVPGPAQAPVFELDFGKIGIQICFDLKWEDGWQQLKAAGAEIIFWPSAYAGGQELCSRAWRQQVYVVSSTQKDTSRICDMTGEVLAQTGRWQPNWACAPLNLEKTFLHAWPAVQVFPEIRKRYGRRIRLTTYAEEEWAILESLDPDVKVADILAEYQLPTHYELIRQSALAHAQVR